MSSQLCAGLVIKPLALAEEELKPGLHLQLLLLSHSELGGHHLAQPDAFAFWVSAPERYGTMHNNVRQVLHH